MPRYRIFHLKDSHLATFRQSAPKKPPYHVKFRYYDECGEIEAVNLYAAWKALQGDESEQPDAGDQSRARIFGVGDVLESDDSGVWICQFWGFDGAEWILPEQEFNRESTIDSGAYSGGAGAENRAQAMPGGAP